MLNHQMVRVFNVMLTLLMYGCDDSEIERVDDRDSDRGAEFRKKDPPVVPGCGNGQVHKHKEECDDGNLIDGDGCSAMCTIELPVQQCDLGVDPLTNSQWVVCESSADSVWISAASSQGGQYYALAICQSLGYPTLSEWGGSCGSVCGYCEEGTSCDAPGSKIFDGAGLRPDGILELTVQWLCTK